MQTLLDYLVRHGHAVVFLWVLIDQAGVPIPGVPLLLAAGALAGRGQLDLSTIVALSVLASLLSDTLWFAIGRRRGASVLGLLCRISLEPESCVRRTETMFAGRGPLTVVLAKFLPGLSTAAPPLAGMFGMPLHRFLWLDGLGALLWTVACVVPGYLCSDRLEQIADNAALTGTWLLALLGAVVGLYVLWKFVRRQLFLRRLRTARLLPEALKQLLDDGAAPFIVDLRHAIDFASDPYVIPGALRIEPEAITDRHAEIPRDRDIVLYCT